jgi:hypothetical protein
MFRRFFLEGFAWLLMMYQLLMTVVKVCNDRNRATRVVLYKRAVLGIKNMDNAPAYADKTTFDIASIISHSWRSWTDWCHVLIKSLREPDTKSMIMELSWFDVLMQGFGISSFVYYIIFLHVKQGFYEQSRNGAT